MKTKVTFRKIKWLIEEQTEIVAIFPKQYYNRQMYGGLLLNSYSHLGQHSSIHKDFLLDESDEVKVVCKASYEEYLSLFNELKYIGYTLEVV